MSDNKIDLGGILSEGYGVNPKKLWKMKIGEYELKNGKKVKGIYIKAVLSYMLSYTGGGKNTCFPTIKQITKHLEIGHNIVVNAINAASQGELGLIEKKQMYPDNPLRHNNMYVMSFLGSDGKNYDIHHEGITFASGDHYVVTTAEQNNNINNNNINNIYQSDNNPPSSPTPKKKSIKKKKYGEKVKLTDKEYNKLCSEYNAKTIDDYITKMNGYLVAHGKTYKNYSQALRNWIGKDIEAGKLKLPKQPAFTCPKCGGHNEDPMLDGCYDCNTRRDK